MRKQFILILLSILVLSTSFIFSTVIFADIAENSKSLEESARDPQKNQEDRIAELDASKFLEFCQNYTEIAALDEMNPIHLEKCNELMSEQED